MIFSPSQFLTRSLSELEWGNKVANILAASINAVDPASAVSKSVIHDARNLIVQSKIYPLDIYKNIYVVGAGKAGFPMACAILDLLGDFFSTGLVIVKDGHIFENKLIIGKDIHFIEAGHPLPDKRGISGTNKIIDLLRSTTEKDLVICLISGGGSSLLVRPADGIELHDLQELIGELLKCGATIHEINILRKHLETIKGGGLLRYAFPSSVLSLILSDVIGDQLDVIASGPTATDSSSYEDAYSVLKKYELIGRTPESIMNYLEKGLNGEVPETLKLGDPITKIIQNVIIASNKMAALAATKQAKLEGFNTLLLTTTMQGKARNVGEFLAYIAQQMSSDYPPIARPSCIVCGGETTVVVKGSGKGGRNTELALGAVNPMSGLTKTLLVTLATDGGDGSTDAAGAVATGETCERARSMNMQPVEYLENNDSYNFFLSLGDLLKLGPTHTNVNDLTFIFSL